MTTTELTLSGLSVREWLATKGLDSAVIPLNGCFITKTGEVLLPLSCEGEEAFMRAMEAKHLYFHQMFEAALIGLLRHDVGFAPACPPSAKLVFTQALDVVEGYSPCLVIIV